MKLTVKERFSLIRLLPQRADIITLTIARDIAEKAEFSQAEIKKLNIRQREGGGLQWDDNISAKNITFAEPELHLLKEQVDKLDKDKAITPDSLTVCLKIRDEKGKEK